MKEFAKKDDHHEYHAQEKEVLSELEMTKDSYEEKIKPKKGGCSGEGPSLDKVISDQKYNDHFSHAV